jgi:hypothetical protein
VPRTFYQVVLVLHHSCLFLGAGSFCINLYIDEELSFSDKGALQIVTKIVHLGIVELQNLRVSGSGFGSFMA